MLSQATEAANALVSVARERGKGLVDYAYGLKDELVGYAEVNANEIGWDAVAQAAGMIAAADKVADGVEFGGDAIRREAAEVASAVIANVNAQAKDMTAEAWRLPGSMAAVTGAAPSATVAEIRLVGSS